MSTDSQQAVGRSTDALVVLFFFSRFPERPPADDELGPEFRAELTKFVTHASEHPDFIDKTAGNASEIVAKFWTSFENSHKSETDDAKKDATEIDVAEHTEPKEEDADVDMLENEAEDEVDAKTGSQERKKLSASELTELALKVHTENAHLTAPETNPYDIKTNSEFLAYVMPEQVPEQIQERTSLVELHLTTQSQPISRLLSGAHKTLSTEHYKLSLIEGKLNIIHNRVEELKNHDRWSLRQRQRFLDPPREKTHLDWMHDEMKWMRTCFVEERKFRLALDLALATEAVEEVERRARNKEDAEMDTGESAGDEASDKTHTAAGGRLSVIPKDNHRLPLIATHDQLDSLSTMLYDELTPMQCFTESKYINSHDQLPFVPVSKFLIPPEDASLWHRVVLENPRELPELLTSHEDFEDGDRLFKKSPANMEVRAPQPHDARYINYRLVTIWLPQDDKNLLTLSRQLAYNWDLISSYLMPAMQYTADIERRTPWQCFERWLQLNPSFDVKDLKGRYAEQARIWLDSSLKAQQAIKRRITPVGVGSDNLQRGHKRLRWSSMFEAMRKIKRKRESQPKGNPMRRQAAIDGTQQGSSRGTPTAAELSRIKFDRDRAVAEAYAQEQRSQGNSGRFASPRHSLVREAMRPAMQRPTAPPANAPVPGPTTIAGLPVPNSVAAAAAANAANSNQQLSSEQLQQLARRGAIGSGASTPTKRPASSSSGPTTPAFPYVGGSPQLQKASFQGSPHASPAARPAMLQGAAAAQRPRGPPLSREQVAALMTKIAQKHPNLTREQIQQLATQEIQLYIQKRSQAAQAQAAAQAARQAGRPVRPVKGVQGIQGPQSRSATPLSGASAGGTAGAGGASGSGGSGVNSPAHGFMR